MASLKFNGDECQIKYDSCPYLFENDNIWK